SCHCLLYRSPAHRSLHSFPTRRSSDLLPRLHEDDALRAVRAAAEMGTVLQELNVRLQATWGVRLENRTGVNTGEVITGTAATGRSEEHTSELQLRSDLVCRLLLEKKKN